MARIRVEVAHALADRQDVATLELPAGTSAAEAVRASGLGEAGARFGIGGKAVQPDRQLRDGERVDILRPLALDPGEARRRRARKRR